jgi:hypothetical protein
MCYLFKSKANKGKGTSAFTSDGWNNWNKGSEALLKHVGSMSHKTSKEKYLGFINPNAAIDNKIEKWSDDDHNLYKIRLTYSLRCLKFLLHQGLSFRGLECDELETGRGLNQEMGLPRPGETRWGPYYKTKCNIITMYPVIRDVLMILGEDTTIRSGWTKIHSVLGAFE